jgi:hypothetical protein
LAGRARTALRLQRPLTRNELGLAWLALLVLGIVAFGAHIRDGGFHLDDWSNGAISLQPHEGDGFGATISKFADDTLFRPVLILYVPLTYVFFGMDPALHLTWTAFLAVAVASLLYAVLRTLGVPWLHGLAISALVLLYPWSDALHLWTTAAQLSLSIAFFLAGCWIALANLRRKLWPWHAVAAGFYLASILTYEVALPAIAAMGVLYLLRTDWGTAKWRWAVDLGAVLIGGAWVGSHTTRTKSGLGGNIEHLGEIVDGGVDIVSRSVVPLHTPSTLVVLGSTALIFICGLAILALRRTPGDATWGLREWLLLGAGGGALVVLGWTIFIPADPHYTPVIYGITNRVNALAGIGAVIAVYAALGVLGNLAGLVLRRRGALPVAITVVLALSLGAAYMTVLQRHIGIWNSAWSAESTALERIEARYPRLPDSSTLIVSGYPAYQTVGVPILSEAWDLEGMIRTRYEDGSLFAYPLIEGYRLSCRRERIVFENAAEVIRSAPYGSVRILDLGDGDGALPRDRRQCLAALPRFKALSVYLSYDY